MPAKTPPKINRLKRARQTVLFQTMAGQDVRKIRYKEARLQLPVVDRAKRFNERARHWNGPLTPRMKRAIKIESAKRMSKAAYLRLAHRTRTIALKLKIAQPRRMKKMQRQQTRTTQTTH